VPEKTYMEWISYFKRKGETVTRVSALTGRGIDELRDMIAEKKSSRVFKDCAN
jgi:translation initiation factor IF-2